MFPENIALPIGGPRGKRHAVIEMHYDNPNFKEGIIASLAVAGQEWSDLYN